MESEFDVDLDSEIASQIRAARSVADLEKTLENLLNSGVSVWGDGSLCFTRARVAAIKGLRFEVYPRDHPPPHFHVRYDTYTAKFALDDCRLLSGSLPAGNERLVRWFFEHGGSERLTAAWTATRPGMGAA